MFSFSRVNSSPPYLFPACYRVADKTAGRSVVWTYRLCLQCQEREEVRSFPGIPNPDLARRLWKHLVSTTFINLNVMLSFCRVTSSPFSFRDPGKTAGRSAIWTCRLYLSTMLVKLPWLEREEVKGFFEPRPFETGLKTGRSLHQWVLTVLYLNCIHTNAC